MRSILRRALHAPRSRHFLFARVSLLLLALNAGLRLFPFARVYQFVRRYHPASRPAPASPEVVAQTCWAVNRAGKFFFGEEGCLPKAMLGEALLLRRGVAAKMRIGVVKEEGGALMAHAWVETKKGTVLIGGRTSPAKFKNLPEIQRVIGQIGGRE